MGVTSLSGIVDKMTNLESLNCSNNNLTYLDLSKNTKLTTLNVKGNKNLTKVNFASFDKIENCKITYDSSTSLYVYGDTLYQENVIIDGLRWAKYAVGASESDLFGKQYYYTAINTACPAGWRVPTKAEYESLMKNYSAVVSYNNAKGRWLSGSKGYSAGVPSLYLTYYQLSGIIVDGGFYWSSTKNEAAGKTFDVYYGLQLDVDGVSISQGDYENTTAMIRCVSNIRIVE